MKRRMFLTLAGSGIIASTSGCLGYSLQSISEIERRESELERQNETITNYQTEVERKESTIADLEEQIESKDSEVSELESEVDEWKGKLILDLYSWGISLVNTGDDEWSRGIEFWNAGSYSEARAQFNLAAGYYHSAVHNFQGAEDRADELDHPTVSEYANEAKTHAEYLMGAAANYQISAYHAVREQYTTAQDYQDNGDRNLQRASNYEVKPLSDLESELGVSLDD